MEPSANGKNMNDEQQKQVLFMMLVQQHQQIAMMGMGKIKNPATDKVDRDLKTAKFAIDTLNMLNTYTEGNLPKELSDYFSQTLTNLRLNYADEKKKGDQPQPTDSDDEAQNDKGSEGDEEN